MRTEYKNQYVEVSITMPNLKIVVSWPYKMSAQSVPLNLPSSMRSKGSQSKQSVKRVVNVRPLPLPAIAEKAAKPNSSASPFTERQNVALQTYFNLVMGYGFHWPLIEPESVYASPFLP